ncbi:hypothetical protein CbuK_2077 [Coxiella burnetii CbuK_Q154]|nr:hypothetical protein CbuK_2077 [Coxiella burnetii CbuK_Q154]
MGIDRGWQRTCPPLERT